MNLPEITKFPVYIISHQRTCSSILMTLIGEKYNLKIFCEPHSLTAKPTLNDLVEYDKNNFNYILKVHGYDLHKYPQFIIDKCYTDDIFKINIRRRDRIRQVASSMIAVKRNKWRYTLSDSTYDEKFEFSDTMIENHIKTLEWRYKIIDDLNINYDRTIYSEDLGVMEHSLHVATPVPSNYDELLTAIQKIYEKRIENGN